jgi:putative exporter of polyketide antibiotics
MPRPQFSIRTLFWLMLVVAAFFGGVAFALARAKQDLEAKVNYYEQDRTHREKVLREVVGENLELRQRLGLPLGRTPRHAANDD